MSAVILLFIVAAILLIDLLPETFLVLVPKVVTPSVFSAGVEYFFINQSPPNLIVLQFHNC